jgi:hypothetical protein
MPRFYFDVAGYGTPHPFGLELSDLESARHVALKTACGLVQQRTSDFWGQGGEWQMTVMDDRRMTLFILTFLATDAPVAGRE